MGVPENCTVWNVENCTSLKCRIPSTVKVILFNTNKILNHDPIKNLKNKKIDATPCKIEPRTPAQTTTTDKRMHQNTNRWDLYSVVEIPNINNFYDPVFICYIVCDL